MKRPSRRASWTASAALLLGGAAAVALLAELSLRVAGAVLSRAETRDPGGAAGGVRVLCLGESTTSADFPSDHSWPAQMQALLDAEAAAPRVVVYNRGRLGTITPVIADRLPWLLDAVKPRIVITMMGINDRGTLASAPARTAPSLRLVRVWGWVRREARRREWLAGLERRARAEGPEDSRRREQACAAAAEAKMGAVDLSVCESMLRGAAARRAAPWTARYDYGAALWADRRPDAEREFAAALEAARAAGEEAGARVELADFYLKMGEWEKSERVWRAAWAASPDDRNLLFQRYSWLAAQRRDAEAAALARGAIGRRPKDGAGHYLLFKLADDRRRLDAAALREGEEACRLSPGAVGYAADLANAYASLGRLDDADRLMEPLRRRGLDALAETPVRAFGLAKIDALRGRAAEAAAIYRRAVAEERALRPTVEGVCELLLRAGRRAEAAVLFDLIEDERGADLATLEPPRATAEEQTRESYARIGALLRERGVVWIAMQYPMRRAEALRPLVAAFPEARLVENRENFLAASRGVPAPRFFYDLFAGDFGHATPAGDRLIAENAAKAVRAALAARDVP